MLRHSGQPARHGLDEGPSPRRERNAAATRQRLLDSAENEFAARGFAGARLRDVAEAAGVQQALIHHYFADKQGLYRAVLDRALLATATASSQVLEQQKDLDGVVRGLVDMLVTFNAEHQNFLAILRHESATGGNAQLDVFRERALPVVEAVTSFIEERRRRGEVRANLDAREAIAAAMAMATHPFAEAALIDAVLPGMVPRTAPALERRKAFIAELLLFGIRSPPAARRGAKARLTARTAPKARAR